MATRHVKKFVKRPLRAGHEAHFDKWHKVGHLKSRHVVIDCDPGTDDALAIFMLHQAHRNPEHPIHIDAITCVSGNAHLDNVIMNTGRILNVLGETKIPVYRGAEHQLVKTTFREEPPYNGVDGFGDTDLPHVQTKVEEEGAVAALVRLMESHQGELSIVALGPLTNLALAIRMNPKIATYPKEIFILGGNHEGIGNVSAAAEFNFMVDPEAARGVLESFKCPITVVPLEAWEKFGTSTYDFRMNKIGKIPTAKAEFMNKIEAKIIARNNDDWWNNPDSLLAAVFINPQVATKMDHFYCTVELNGQFTRGMMVVDRKSHLAKTPNVNVVSQIDLDMYLDMCLEAVSN